MGKSMKVTETLELSAVVWREKELYVASQGRSVEEALSNLKEALELYFEDENVMRPSEAEAPFVTIVKVRVSGPTDSVRAQSN